MSDARNRRGKVPSPMKRTFKPTQSFAGDSQAEPRGIKQTALLEELEAEAIDDGKLHGYKHDEREIQIFEGLHYSPKHRQWIARFRIIAHPKGPPLELTHAEVLTAGRTLLALNTKPSQCLKASRAFSAKLNCAAQGLTFDI